jgi:hypothetical protein
MEHRELSSPVSHIDCDAEPVAVQERSKPSLCNRCVKVLAAFEEAHETISGQNNVDAKIFVSEIDLATILRPACFLCRRLFRNAHEWQGEVKRLVDGLPVVVEYSRRISQGPNFLEHFMVVNFQGDRTPICNLTILSVDEGKLLQFHNLTQPSFF